MATKTKKRKRGLPFSKLSAEAKEKAREWWRDCERYDGSDDLSEMFKNDLEDHYGISGCEVYFALGHCQGDGVSFQGTPDLDRWRAHDKDLDDKITELEAVCGLLGFEDPDLYVNIEDTSRCYSMDLTFEYLNEPQHDPQTCGCERVGEISWSCGYIDGHKDETKSEWTWIDPHGLPGLDRVHELADGIREYMEDRIKAIADEMESDGYAEIDHKDSDEYIDEHLELNDYRFTREGEIL